jgi:hypothetical protein
VLVVGGLLLVAAAIGVLLVVGGSDGGGEDAGEGLLLVDFVADDDAQTDDPTRRVALRPDGEVVVDDLPVGESFPQVGAGCALIESEGDGDGLTEYELVDLATGDVAPAGSTETAALHLGPTIYVDEPDGARVVVDLVDCTVGELPDIGSFVVPGRTGWASTVDRDADEPVERLVHVATGRTVDVPTGWRLLGGGAIAPDGTAALVAQQDAERDETVAVQVLPFDEGEAIDVEIPGCQQVRSASWLLDGIVATCADGTLFGVDDDGSAAWTLPPPAGAVATLLTYPAPGSGFAVVQWDGATDEDRTTALVDADGERSDVLVGRWSPADTGGVAEPAHLVFVPGASTDDDVAEGEPLLAWFDLSSGELRTVDAPTDVASFSIFVQIRSGDAALVRLFESLGAGQSYHRVDLGTAERTPLDVSAFPDPDAVACALGPDGRLACTAFGDEATGEIVLLDGDDATTIDPGFAGNAQIVGWAGDGQ